MLASGRPVVAMAKAGSEIARAIEGSGIRVDCGDVEAFAGAICHLAAARSERSSLGENARRSALSRFRQDVILTSLEESFEALRRPLQGSLTKSGQRPGIVEDVKSGVRG